MVRGYAGKVINGKPALTEAVILPEDADIIIMVLSPQDSKITIKSDEEDTAKRLKMVESITGIIPPDVDEKAMREERIAKRGLLE